MSLCLLFQMLQHSAHAHGHGIEGRSQRIAYLFLLLLLRKAVVAGDDCIQPVEIVAADVAQVTSQLIGQRVAVAVRRLVAVVVQLPVGAQNLVEAEAVVRGGAGDSIFLRNLIFLCFFNLFCVTIYYACALINFCGRKSRHQRLPFAQLLILIHRYCRACEEQSIVPIECVLKYAFIKPDN